ASAPNLWVYASRKGLANKAFTPLGLAGYPKWAKQFKGIYVMSPDPAIIVYNKLLVKDKVPTSVAQIARDSSTYGSVTGYTANNTLADVYAKVGAKKVYMPGFTQKFVNARPKFAAQWHGIFG